MFGKTFGIYLWINEDFPVFKLAISYMYYLNRYIYSTLQKHTTLENVNEINIVLNSPGVGPAPSSNVGVVGTNCNTAATDFAAVPLFTTLQFAGRNGLGLMACRFSHVMIGFSD